jgi:lipopolysaccharide export system protein LptA
MPRNRFRLNSFFRERRRIFKGAVIMRNNKYHTAGVRIFFLTAILALILSLSAAPAPAQNRKLGNREVPTNVSAMRMSYDAGKEQVVFENNVKVVRPDFELDADRLVIHLKSRPGGAGDAAQEDDPLAGMSGGEIDRLVAQGNVQMRKDGRIGSCGQATYYMDRELLVMEQSPVLHDGENSIRGQVINFFVAENRSEVLGAKGSPVQATFKSSNQSSGKNPLNLE